MTALSTAPSREKRRTRSHSRAWWLPPLIGAALLVATASAMAGGSGAVVACSLLVIVPLIGIWSIAQYGTERPPPVRTPIRLRRWPTFEGIASDLHWATISQRHFDSAPRRTLQRAAAAVLERRAGIDFHAERDRERAAELIGPEFWPLLDPHRKASIDSSAPGVDSRTIERLLTRLEQL